VRFSLGRTVLCNRKRAATSNFVPLHADRALFVQLFLDADGQSKPRTKQEALYGEVVRGQPRTRQTVALPVTSKAFASRVIFSSNTTSRRTQSAQQILEFRAGRVGDGSGALSFLVSDGPPLRGAFEL
jgi:hypothetical protein